MPPSDAPSQYPNGGMPNSQVPGTAVKAAAPPHIGTPPPAAMMRPSALENPKTGDCLAGGSNCAGSWDQSWPSNAHVVQVRGGFTEQYACDVVAATRRPWGWSYATPSTSAAGT